MSEADSYVRKTIEACARCEQAESPYAYLHNGHHYCIRCARLMLVRDKIRPAGRRTDDLTVEDVLFLELPDPNDPHDL